MSLSFELLNCSDLFHPDAIEYNVFITSLSELLTKLRSSNRYSFEQYGIKSGELYFTHIVKGVQFILSSSSSFLEHNPTENSEALLQLKLLSISYIIHDLNKLQLYENPWSVEFILNELNELNIISINILHSILNYEEYINDIYFLIVGHSRISNQLGRIIAINSEADLDTQLFLCLTSNGGIPIVLPKYVLYQLIYIMQLTDTIDVVQNTHGIVALNKKDQYEHTQIRYLNQYQLEKYIKSLLCKIIQKEILLQKITVKQDVSILSNIILNCAIDKIKNYGFEVLFICGDGVFCYGIASEILKTKCYIELPTRELVLAKGITQKIYTQIGKTFMQKITSLASEFLYKTMNYGYEPTEFVFMSPNVDQKIEKYLQKLEMVITGYKYKKPVSKAYDENSSRYGIIQKLRWDYNKKDGFKSENGFISKDIIINTPIISDFFDSQLNTSLFENDNLWKIGQFLQAGYILLRRISELNKTKITNEELMKELTINCNCFNQIESFYNKSKRNGDMYLYAFNGVLGYAYLKNNPEHTIKDVTPLLINYFKFKTTNLNTLDFVITNPTAIIQKSITIFSQPLSSVELIRYKHPSLYQTYCSTCGDVLLPYYSNQDYDKKKSFEKNLWKSEYTNGIMVQKFDNFKPGGDLDIPQRYACEYCKLKYFIDKLTSKRDNTKYTIFYSYFYLPTFSNVLLSSIKKSFFTAMTNQENVFETFNIDLSEYTYDKFSSTELSNINIHPDTPFGFKFPLISEEIAGSIILPFYAPKSCDTEEYWKYVESSLIFAIKSNLKLIASKFHETDFALLGDYDVIIYDVPPILKDLFGTGYYSFNKAKQLLNIMLYVKNEMYYICTHSETKSLTQLYVMIISFIKYFSRNILDGIKYYLKLYNNINVNRSRTIDFILKYIEMFNGFKDAHISLNSILNFIDKMTQLQLRGKTISDSSKSIAFDTIYSVLNSMIYDSNFEEKIFVEKAIFALEQLNTKNLLIPKSDMNTQINQFLIYFLELSHELSFYEMISNRSVFRNLYLSFVDKYSKSIKLICHQTQIL